jgi:hypothetical protein
MHATVRPPRTACRGTALAELHAFRPSARIRYGAERRTDLRRYGLFNR